MDATQTRIVKRIDRILEGMTRAPLMYGGPEAIELQGVQLLKLRLLTTNPTLDGASPRYVIDAWCAFIRARHHMGNRLLSGYMKEKYPDDEIQQAEVIMEHITAFRTDVISVLPLEDEVV